MRKISVIIVLLISSYKSFSQEIEQISLFGGWNNLSYRYFINHKTKYSGGIQFVHFFKNQKQLGIGSRYYFIRTNNTNLIYSFGNFNHLFITGNYSKSINDFFTINTQLGIGFQKIITKFNWEKIVYKENLNGMAYTVSVSGKYAILKNLGIFTEYQFIYGKPFKNQDFSNLNFYYHIYSHAINGGLTISF